MGNCDQVNDNVTIRFLTTVAHVIILICTPLLNLGLVEQDNIDRVPRFLPHVTGS